MPSQTARPGVGWVMAMLAWLTVVEIALLFTLYQNPASFSLLMVIGAIAVFMALLPIMALPDSANATADAAPGPVGIQATLKGQQEQLLALQRRAEKTEKRLEQLLLLMMPSQMFFNLSKFARPEGFGEYFVSEDLKRELIQMNQLGFVEFQDVNAIPETGSNLSDHVQITSEGKEYAILRGEIESSKASSNGEAVNASQQPVHS